MRGETRKMEEADRNEANAGTRRTRVIFLAVLVSAFASVRAAEPAPKEPKLSADEVRRLITQLGDEEYEKREAAHQRLESAGASIEGDLKKAAEASSDPEIALRLKRIIETIHRKRVYGNLTKEEAAIAQLPFSTALKDDGESAGRRTYCMNNYGITDIGDVRIAFKGLTFSGMSSGSISLSTAPGRGGGGRTGSGNRRFEYNYGGGKTTCKFGGVSFSITGGVITIGGHKVAFGKKTVVILSEERKVLKVVELGAAKKRKKKQETKEE